MSHSIMTGLVEPGGRASKCPSLSKTVNGRASSRHQIGRIIPQYVSTHLEIRPRPQSRLAELSDLQRQLRQTMAQDKQTHLESRSQEEDHIVPHGGKVYLR